MCKLKERPKPKPCMSSIQIEVTSASLSVKIKRQGNYQPHHFECTFYINFVLTFEGMKYIFTNILTSLNFFETYPNFSPIKKIFVKSKNTPFLA